MALRQIRQYGDIILQKKAKPVLAFDNGLHALLGDMWDTLRENEGLGLAATQVGVLRRVIVIDLEEESYELINPVLVESGGNEIKCEACLSVPNKQGDVERPTIVVIEAYDRSGEPFTLEADDLLATALCHELDHLDGVLFLDKATNITERPDEEVKNARARRKKTPKPKPGKKTAGLRRNR